MWAALLSEKERPLILNKPHDDWILPSWIPVLGEGHALAKYWPMQYVPRSWNAWINGKEPVKILGNVPEDSHLDVPPLGTWVLARPGGSFGSIWMVLSLASMLWAMLDGHYMFIPPPLHFAISIKRLHRTARLSVVRHDYVDGYETGPAGTWKRKDQ